jgi:hypothetical protein
VQAEREDHEQPEREVHPSVLEAEAAAGIASAAAGPGSYGSPAVDVAVAGEEAEATASGGFEDHEGCTQDPEHQAKGLGTVVFGSQEDQTAVAAEVAATDPEVGR